MKSLPKKCKTAVVTVGSITCLMIITDGAVNAQRVNARATGASGRIERMQRQKNSYERDQLERQRANASEHPRTRKKEADAFQAKQDFLKLQTNYNRMVLAMGSKELIQGETLLADVAEIEKAATRLRTKMALPISADVELASEPTVESGTSDSLLKLLQHIHDFLTNPLFDSPPAYKVEAAKKASIDLHKIIRISETIRKQAAVP